MTTTKHRSPATVRLRMTDESGDVTSTTWGEFLAANRKDRSTCGAVWLVVTRHTPRITLGGGAAPMVTIELDETVVE